MPRETDFTGYDEASITFLNAQNKGTKATYKAYFKLFLTYTAMTGQQILDSRKSDKNFEWETKVLNFKQWMKKQKAKNGEYYSDNAVSTAVNTVRSFFDHYHTKLNFNHSEARKLNGKPERVTKDYQLTNPVLEKMAFVANLRDKYIVLLGKSLGLRASDFVTLTYGDFKVLDLNQEPPIFIREIITKKEKVKANLFIDADALPIIKQIIDSNKDRPANEPIIKVNEDELSTIIQRLAEKAKIDIGDCHLRFHCFRKYLMNWLARAIVSDSITNQIVGKAFSQDAYVDNSRLRESYLKVMEFTTINKEKGNGKVSKLSEEITELQTTVKTLSKEFNKKDLELEEVKNVLKALRNIIMALAESDIYRKTGAESMHENLANKITTDAEFMKKYEKDFEKLKSGYFKPDKK